MTWLLWITGGVITAIVLAGAALMWVASHAERPENESERSISARKLEDELKKGDQ